MRLDLAKKYWKVIAFAWVMFMALPYSATASELLRLQCQWVSSIDGLKGTEGPTTGTTLFNLLLGSNGLGTMKQEGLGAAYSVSFTTEKIEGETRYQIGGILHQVDIYINRYTGKITQKIKFGEPATGILIHNGNCAPIVKPLF